ncbi:MAG: hypothetical protein KIG60_05980 [Caryophanon sp.]|nr:hypothetical protein [Caryophanon sp.]
MFWLMIALIVAITTGGEAYKAYLKNNAKTLELREKLLKDEYKLELAKQETLRLENERLRLELDADTAQFEQQKKLVHLEK